MATTQNGSKPKSSLKRAVSVTTPSGEPAPVLQRAGIHATSPKANRRVSDNTLGASIKQYMKDVNANLKRAKTTTQHTRSSTELLKVDPKYLMAQPDGNSSASTSPARSPAVSTISEAAAAAPVTSGETESDEYDELKVPALLIQGTPMTKVSATRPKTRLFRLDPDQGQILWPSKKSGIITIENIKEIRTGTDARYYREQFKIAPDAEPRWLTIVYICDGKYKTLHLVAFTVDVFRMWDTTLRRLYRLRQDLMGGLGQIERREMIWEKQYWKGADESGDQKLDFNEVEAMCLRLNINSPREDLEKRFKEADTEGKGHLNFKDFQKFVKLLKTRPELSRLYKALCVDGKFTFDVFERFMRDRQKSTATQQELERIFVKFAKPSKSEHSTGGDGAKLPPVDPGSPPAPPQPSALSPTAEFIHLPTTPTPTSPPASLKPDPLASPSLLTTIDPNAPPQSITERETVTSPTDDAPPSPTALSQNWSLGAFTSFLLSADNSPFSDHHSKVWQDMTRPLSEYFISSSHNTYLVGNQLVGDSTIEGYIRALLHSCRSVELDIYDGDTEPVVYHGRTLTSKVLLRDICHVIAKYAFIASQYPIIISAEVHCGLDQQGMIAQIFKVAFGEMLVQSPIKDEKIIEELPSPEDLKNRVLLKAKNLYVASNGTVQQKDMTVDAQSSSTETSSESEPAKELKEFKDEVKEGVGRARNLVNRAFGRKKKPEETATPPNAPAKVKMSLELAALLVYTVGVKCRGFNKKENYAIEHVFSLSEKTANKILKDSVADLVKHNRTHVVRIYPNGTRLSSTNFEPHRYWAAGAQLVAINWQTFDLGYMINHTMFERNGRSGYVLKPEALRLKDKEAFAKRTKHFLDIKVISAQQLPRPRDDTGREILGRSIIDPYVEVSVHIPDWSTSPFLPEAPVNYSPASGPSTSAGTAADASSARSFIARTSVVKNNGFNPVWEEDCSLPFDCVGNMKELIFVKFAIRAEKMDSARTLAVYCVSLGSLQQGYRHLPLHDQQMSQFLFSTLFVNISIRDI